MVCASSRNRKKDRMEAQVHARNRTVELESSTLDLAPQTWMCSVCASVSRDQNNIKTWKASRFQEFGSSGVSSSKCNSSRMLF